MTRISDKIKRKGNIPEVPRYEIFSWGWGSWLLLKLILEPEPKTKCSKQKLEFFSWNPALNVQLPS